MMMNSNQSREKSSKIKNWGRYGSLMLVGEHGQVIPFRRFKSLLILGVGMLIVALVSAAVLGVVVVSRTGQINTLRQDLEENQQQLAQLRDEKDMLLTQMVLSKQQAGKDPQVAAEAPAQDKSASSPESPALPPAVPAEAPKAKASQPQPVASVKLSADVKELKVTYRPESHLLSIAFRLYNTSKPKVPLAGRTVVVFKNHNEPPIFWLPVPRVQLVDGKPSGQRGKAFKINNYRTEAFKVYNQKAPIRYNTVTIFVYSSDGELLLTKDHSFKIDAPPEPPPIIPVPKPVEVKTAPQATPGPPVERPAQPPGVSPPVVTDTGNAVDSSNQEIDSTAATDAQRGMDASGAPSGGNPPSPGGPSNQDPPSDSGIPATEGEEAASPAHVPPVQSIPTTQGEPQ
jgi:hypothetical protein